MLRLKWAITFIPLDPGLFLTGGHCNINTCGQWEEAGVDRESQCRCGENMQIPQRKSPRPAGVGLEPGTRGLQKNHHNQRFFVVCLFD